MTIVDTLNTAGFVVTGIGGVIGMIGAIKQANGYYPFKASQLLKHIVCVVANYFFRRRTVIGWVNSAAKLTENRKEDKANSLIGIYFIFIGFLFQMAGATLLFSASLVSAPGH